MNEVLELLSALQRMLAKSRSGRNGEHGDESEACFHEFRATGVHYIDKVTNLIDKKLRRYMIPFSKCRGYSLNNSNLAKIRG